MKIIKRFPGETSREYAFRVIKENIINLELEPGAAVSENALAEELGLSRTPVREAIIELSKTQIIKIYPQKGSFIARIDYAMVDEARFMRLVMEKAVVELACRTVTDQGITCLEENVILQEFYAKNQMYDKMLKLDDDFHKIMFEIVDMPHIYEAIHNMTIHFDRVRSLSLKSVKPDKTVQEHRVILEAIKEKNEKVAVETVEKHLTQYQVEREELEKDYPDYFEYR